MLGEWWIVTVSLSVQERVQAFAASLVQRSGPVTRLRRVAEGLRVDRLRSVGAGGQENRSLEQGHWEEPRVSQLFLQWGRVQAASSAKHSGTALRLRRVDEERRGDRFRSLPERRSDSRTSHKGQLYQQHFRASAEPVRRPDIEPKTTWGCFRPRASEEGRGTQETGHTGHI